jgi:hypothetical protein
MDLREQRCENVDSITYLKQWSSQLSNEFYFLYSEKWMFGVPQKIENFNSLVHISSESRTLPRN